MIGGFKLSPQRTRAYSVAAALLGVLAGCSGGATESVNVGEGVADVATAGAQSATGAGDSHDGDYGGAYTQGVGGTSVPGAGKGSGGAA